jgi:hypothetical protein
MTSKELVYVSYWGGCSGDFLSLLIKSGDSKIRDITINNDIFTISYKNGKSFLMGYDVTGAVKGGWKLSSTISNAYRLHWQEDKFNNFLSSIGTDKTVEHILNVFEKEPEINNYDFDVVSGHEVIAFSDVFETDVSEFKTFCDLNKFDTVILITIDSEKSKKITWINSCFKNNNFNLSDINFDYLPIPAYNKYTEYMKLSGYTTIDVDIIYDKIELKKFIQENVKTKWNDTHYDMIYDSYMEKQKGLLELL